METIVVVVHLLVALAIIGLILMQQGKGAEAGASFGGGGASQTVFGSEGSGNFFAKATAILAFVFFATSFSLAIIAKGKTGISVDSGIPQVEQVIPAAESEFPSIQLDDVPAALDAAIDSELPAVSLPVEPAQ